MPRTETANDKSLTFVLREGPGTLEFVHDEATTADDKTVSYIPPGSAWGPPFHWHQTHEEVFRVRQGFVRVTSGHTTRIYGPDDGEARIKAYVPHTFKRADKLVQAADKSELARRDEQDKGWRDREVIMEEWTVPSDGAKEVFFRNIFSFYKDEIQPLLDSGVSLTTFPTLIAKVVQPLASLDRMDTYIHLVGSWGIKKDGTVNFLAIAASYAFFAFVKFLNLFIGGQYWFKEYTPQRLRPFCTKFIGN